VSLNGFGANTRRANARRKGEHKVRPDIRPLA